MLTIVLALICAGLSAIIYLELDAPEQPQLPAAPEASQPPSPADEISAIVMPPPEAFSSVLERPVFSSTRRPAPGSETANDTPVLSDLELVGIVISHGDRFVLVKPSGGGQLQPAREGEVVGGWSILSITADHVTLRRGGTEMEVALDYTALPPPPRPRAQVQQQQPAAEESEEADQAPEEAAPAPDEAPLE